MNKRTICVRNIEKQVRDSLAESNVNVGSLISRSSSSSSSERQQRYRIVPRSLTCFGSRHVRTYQQHARLQLIFSDATASATPAAEKNKMSRGEEEEKDRFRNKPEVMC